MVGAIEVPGALLVNVTRVTFHAILATRNRGPSTPLLGCIALADFVAKITRSAVLADIFCAVHLVGTFVV